VKTLIRNDRIDRIGYGNRDTQTAPNTPEVREVQKAKAAMGARTDMPRGHAR
jgi:hypothetical protein